jgi:SAM-dependent methyltransferase
VLPPDFDAYADSYRETVQRSIDFCGQDHGHFTRRKAQLLLDLAGRRIGDPGSVSALDVGCGIGVTDVHLVGRFGELHGVDTAEAAMRHAAAHNPSVRYQAYDGGRLPFADRTFDLAFAICVVHHVPPRDRPRFASELRRVVRPGGLAVVFEHNPLNPLTRLAVSRCEFDEDAVLLTRTSTSRLLAGAGLHPLERRYIIFFPFERPRSRAVERRLSWLPGGAQYYVAAER